jgi:ABC-type nitrate/sulfonate/bicarbonate transport system substrate-binding protein
MIMRRTLAVLVAAVVLAVLGAGCSSPNPKSHYSGAVQTGAGGAAALAGRPQSGANSTRDAIRLGFMSTATDGIALVGIQDGLFREGLGTGATLDAVGFSSPAALELALERGRVDAAYLDPVEAVGAWQATHGGIRVMAGAAVAGNQSSVLLAVAARFLASHPLWVQGLLKGHVLAMQLLDSDPMSGWRMAAQELTALGQRVSSRQFARESARISFNCDPLTGSVLAQARRAAETGLLKSVSSLTGMYDLGPVNQLLKSAGFRPISQVAG